jgi:serine/threonine protein kinase
LCVLALIRFLTLHHSDRILCELSLAYRFGRLSSHLLPLLRIERPVGYAVSMILPFKAHQPFQDRFQSATPKHLQDYMRGLLTALAHLHKHNVVHRDGQDTHVHSNSRLCRMAADGTDQKAHMLRCSSLYPFLAWSLSFCVCVCALVKPDNYLFDFDAASRGESTGWLVDFGLAHSVATLHDELLKGHDDSEQEGEEGDGDAEQGERKDDGTRKKKQRQSLNGEGGVAPMDTSDTATAAAPSNAMLQSPRKSKQLPGGAAAAPAPAPTRKSPRRPAAPPAFLDGFASAQSHRRGSAAVAAPGGVHAAMNGVGGGVDERRKRPEAPHVGTRGFRAPEVLLGSLQQGVALDCFSAGCMLLSLLSRRSPFFVAETDAAALAEQMDLLAEIDDSVEIVNASGGSEDATMQHSSTTTAPPPSSAMSVACSASSSSSSISPSVSTPTVIVGDDGELEAVQAPVRRLRLHGLTLTQRHAPVRPVLSGSENLMSAEQRFRRAIEVSAGVVWPAEVWPLLHGLLRLHPSKRLSAKRALKLPFFKANYSNFQLRPPAQ